MVLAEALNKNVTIKYRHHGATGYMDVYVMKVSGSTIIVKEKGDKLSSSLPLNGDFRVEEIYVSEKRVYDFNPNDPWFKK